VYFIYRLVIFPLNYNAFCWTIKKIISHGWVSNLRHYSTAGNKDTQEKEAALY